MTEQCQNCGEPVSDDYVRVFGVERIDGVRCCPYCPDLIRRNGQIETPRASRRVDRNTDVHRARDEGQRPAADGGQPIGDQGIHDSDAGEVWHGR